jgi:hypothetical protein
MLLTFVQKGGDSEIQYGVESKCVPPFFKEGFGAIYQSVIMKLGLTDQHYSDQEGLFILLPVIRYQK